MRWKFYLLAIASLMLWDVTAYSASVKAVNKKKGLVSVKDIEDGDEITKGAHVCFYDDSQKIGCAAVIRAKGSSAVVKVRSKKLLKKLKSGMDVKLAGKKQSKKSSGGEAETASSYKGSASPWRFWALFSPALSTPATYNKLSYALPATTSPDTLWSTNGPSQTAFLAFNFQAGIPLGSFAILPGFRYRIYSDSRIDSDYSASNKNLFARVEEKASAIGFWTDFQYFRLPISPSFAFQLTSGLDIDMSSVKLTATGKDDSGTQADASIATADSKLTVVSLRLGAGTDYMLLGALGAHLGLTAMLPLTELSKSFKGSADDPNASGMADPGADLKTALGHKKNSLAYELSLGIVLAF